MPLGNFYSLRKHYSYSFRRVVSAFKVATTYFRVKRQVIAWLLFLTGIYLLLELEISNDVRQRRITSIEKPLSPSTLLTVVMLIWRPDRISALSKSTHEARHSSLMLKLKNSLLLFPLKSNPSTEPHQTPTAQPPRPLKLWHLPHQ